MTEHVQTKSDIRSILDRLGAHPRKRFGQNFLIDGNLMRRLVDSAEIQAGATVLEVGPGTGGLTDMLANRAGSVIAVEIDQVLAAHLRERFAEGGKVEVIECDILENKHHICPAVLAALNRATGDPSGPWKLIANLPYSIATPLLINLMLLENPPLRMCFTVQKEVADRIDARPCTRDYGPVSIVLQRTCRISRIAELPPDVFWPAPEVSSTMLRLDLLHESLSPTLSAESAFIRSCFLHRRKTLRSNLLRACGQEMVDQLAKVMDLTRRPEALSVDEWFDLSHRVIVS